MKVAEVMNKNVVTCHPSEKLTVIINKFELFHIAGMPVTEKGSLVGIVTQTDVLRAVREAAIEDEVVRDVMTAEVVVISPTDSATHVARLMIEKGINRIPVVEDGKLVGIVTRGDLIRAAAVCE
ncbi:MAG TPA: CBS domain-containing protein [Syntrophorhabdales bacterium]|nr:CBS domain-containing protein [Syntrophorhabdales bacterium]